MAAEETRISTEPATKEERREISQRLSPGPRRTAPKLTVTTPYGTFSRRTWRPYQFVLLIHGPKYSRGTWAESWTEQMGIRRLEALARTMRDSFRLREKLAREGDPYTLRYTNPAEFRAADFNFTVHRVSDGEEVWAL